MNELPSGWNTAAIEDVADYQRGVTYKKDQVKDQPRKGLIPVLRATNFNKEFDLSDLVYLPLSNILDQQKLIKGDVLFAMSSGSLRHVGKSVLLRNNMDAAFGAFCGVIRPKDERLSKWLSYYFSERSFRRYAEEMAKGTNINNLKKEHLLTCAISIPPLNEQRRIVDKIEQLFDLLDKGEESLRAARDKAGLYRHSLLKHAFEGHLTADWRAANPDKLEDPETLLTRIQNERDARYKEALDDWQDALAKWRAADEEGKKPAKPQRPKGVDEIKPEELSDLAGLPDSWAYVRLGEFVYGIDAGKSFKCDESEPVGDQIGVAKVSAVSWGAYDESESKTCVDPLKINPNYFIADGDFILSRANTIELVGACVIVNKVTRSVMLSDKTLRIDFLAGDRRFFLHYLRSATGRSEIEKRSTGNQESMRNIGQDRIRSIIFPLCSPAEQSEIVSRLEAKLSTLDALEADIDTQLARSRALRQSILKRAFEGKLVPQDPTEEPASALLERIKADRAASPQTK